VAVGSDEVVRCLLHQPRERLPVEVMQDAGLGLAGQMVDGQDVAVGADGGEVAGDAGIGGTAPP
jgi:hypothetical protein